MNPGRDSATNQIRRKEPQSSTTTNYHRIGTKFNEAKTNRSPARGGDFSGKGDIPNTSLDPTSRPATELAPEKDVSLTSRAVTKPPLLTLEGTSASKTALRFPQGNVPGTVESLSTASVMESQEVSTDLSDEESLLTSVKLDPGADDSSGSSPTTAAVPFTSENIAHGYEFSSENPEAVTYDVLIPEPTRNVSEESASSGSEESLRDPSGEGSVWFPGPTDGRTQPDVGSGGEGLLPTHPTEIHVDASEKTAESSSPGPWVPQGSSVTDMEVPPSSSFAFFPTEVTPRAFTPSSGKRDSAPTVHVVYSQTTQPVYNGETPLQPPCSSGAFPLVTPVLLGHPVLDTPPAASSSDPALHATPVFPSVPVSCDSILSSSDGAPLLPFSSASFSSESFRHLYTASQILPQVTSAGERAQGFLHASLPGAGGDVLLAPSLALSSPVMAHQATPHAASETLEFGGSGAGVLHKTRLSPPAEPASSDVTVHARSPGPEPSSAWSHAEASRHLVAVSYGSAVPVHASVGVSSRGSFLSGPSHTPLPQPSLISPTSPWLQPTHGLSGDGEWSGASSESGLLSPDPDGLTVLNISPPVSVAEFAYTISVLGDDDDKPLSQRDVGGGNQTELPISPFTERGSRPEGTVTPGLYRHVNKLNASLQESPVSISHTKGIPPGSLAYTTTKVFDHEISQPPENNFSVQPTHAVSQAAGDPSLTPVLSAKPAPPDPAASETLSPSTQLLFYEASASFNPEVSLQPSFQVSDVDTLLKTALSAVPRGPISAASPKVEHISPTILHPMASSSASSESMLHSTSVPVFGVSPASNVPAASLQSVTVSYANKKDVEPVSLKSESSQQVVPSLFSNDKFFQTARLELNHAFPPEGRQAFATPVLSMDVPPSTLLNEFVYPDEAFLSTKGSITEEVLAGLPAVVSDTLLTADHSVPLGNAYVSIPAIFPSKDGSVATTKLLFPSKTISELTHSARSDAELVGGGGGDDDDDDDRDRDGLAVNKCMSCSFYRESQEKVMNDSDPKENSLVDQNNPVSYSLSEKSAEESKVTVVTSESQTYMDRRPNTSPSTNVLSPKHGDGKQGSDLETANALLPFPPASTAWAVLTGDGESGSGQSVAGSLNENEAATAFRFPDVNESAVAGALEAGDSEGTPGSPRSSAPTVASRHSEVVSISEAG